MNFLSLRQTFGIERMTIPRKKLLERIIDQFLVIKTDIWDKKNDNTKKEAAGENNRSISCH